MVSGHRVSIHHPLGFKHCTPTGRYWCVYVYINIPQKNKGEICGEYGLFANADIPLRC